MLAFMSWFGASADAVNMMNAQTNNAVIVKDAARAELNWKFNCQGCHGVRGEGSPGGAPPMQGVVAQFLKTEGGRAYLGRVPGVAHAPMSDEELADVLNWMLLRFSCEPLPAGFRGYQPEEVAQLRNRALITNAHEVRSELVSKILTAGLSNAAGAGANREAELCSH